MKKFSPGISSLSARQQTVPSVTAAALHILNDAASHSPGVAEPDRMMLDVLAACLLSAVSHDSSHMQTLPDRVLNQYQPILRLPNPCS